MAEILLHSCCAPCSGAIVEWMDKEGMKPVIFFSNSNISPKEEYDLRLSEVQRYAALFGFEVVADEYDHEAWLKAVRGLEREPERGRRCEECFRFRLSRAAAFARSKGFDVLTTTLASSRWKDLSQVGRVGAMVCGSSVENLEEIAPDSSLVFWDKNWRKGGLQPRRSEIIREQNFYNQTFCGCEFSRRGDEE